MGTETLTDAMIIDLLSCAKRVENPKAKERIEGKHTRRDFNVVSVDEKHRFSVFTRQSSTIPDAYSAGLLWHSKTGEDVTLLRCNGSNHDHPNPLERTRIDHRCHVHKATERYISVGKKPETFATETTEYNSLAGALHKLARLANIQGLGASPHDRAQSDMFERNS